MKRLVIDVGSHTTKIYMIGAGVVLSEATCVAIEDGTDGATPSVKTFGDRAHALSGKAAQSTRVINPVCEGNIVQPELLSLLLKYFFEKIELSPRKARSAEVLFVVPCSASPELREKYARVASQCSVGRTYFTRTPFAAVAGHGAPLSEASPVFSLDIGYGKTDIAAFSLDGIISGFTVNLGGGNVDSYIMDLLAESYNLKIGALTAEKIKTKVVSLLEDDNKITLAEGRDLKSGSPSSVSVNSAMTEDIIKLYIDKICDYARTVLTELPAEVSSAVMRGGVYLTGGITKIDGVPEYIGRKLGIRVNTCAEPSLAAVIGGGKLLSDAALCSRLVTLN